MDHFIKKRFSFWLVLFLLIINIAAISTIIYHIYSDNPAIIKTEINSDAGKIITDELGLNSDQKERFETINRFYNQQSQQILSQLTEKRSEMLAEMGEENPNIPVLHAIAKDIGGLHESLKLLTIDNLLELKKICNPYQQQKLSGMYNDMLESEGHFKGYGKQYRHRYRHGQGGGRGWQKNN